MVETKSFQTFLVASHRYMRNVTATPRVAGLSWARSFWTFPARTVVVPGVRPASVIRVRTGSLTMGLDESAVVADPVTWSR